MVIPIGISLLALLATAPKADRAERHLGGVDRLALARVLDGVEYLGGHPFVVREHALDAKNKATCEQLGRETVMKLGEVTPKTANAHVELPYSGDEVLAAWTIDAKLHLREGDDATIAAKKTFDVTVLCREPDSVGLYVFGRANDRACRSLFIRMTRDHQTWSATNVGVVFCC